VRRKAAPGFVGAVVLVGRQRLTRRTVVAWFASENAALVMTHPLAVADAAGAHVSVNAAESTVRQACEVANVLDVNPWASMSHLRTHHARPGGLEAVST